MNRTPRGSKKELVLEEIQKSFFDHFCLPAACRVFRIRMEKY